MLLSSIRSRVPVVIGGVAALLMVGAGVAYASIPSSNGTITACYNSTGAMRLIDPSTGGSCTTSYPNELTWNQTGPAGNATGMANLGAMLTEVDPELARAWTRRAADLGDVGAVYNLGVMLADSEPGEARRWFEQAAGAGHTAARFNLGVLLTPSDPQAARHWYEQAIQADPADELYNFALLARLNLGLLLADSDRPAALEHLRQAADAGVANAVLIYPLLLSEEDPAAADAWVAAARQRFRGS